LRLDMTGGSPQAFALDPAMCFNEPVHVPSREASHEGWLVAVVDRQTGPEDFDHRCWIFNAGDVAAGPVAKIGIPRRLRPQIHGWWVSAEQLAKAA
jgi:carotenoid cleavage dioxygenase-like enzyme